MTTATKTAAIDLVSVDRLYKRGGEEVYALQDFNLSIEEGSFTALMGPSGSGKSTLLNLIGGLDRATKGVVLVAGEELGKLSSGDLARFRADSIGFVFQGFNLLPVLTALQNVELPLLLAPLSRKERRQHALHALELVGLSDRVNHRPRELSGGQEQRVAIARALATDPKLILADEPTGDLDRASADSIMELLSALNKQHGKTIVMVTHDPRAASYAQRIVHLDKGSLERIEETKEAVAAGVFADEAPVADGVVADEAPAADGVVADEAPAAAGVGADKTPVADDATAPPDAAAAEPAPAGGPSPDSAPDAPTPDSAGA